MHQGDWLRSVAETVGAHASEILENPRLYLEDYLRHEYAARPYDPPTSAAQAGYASRLWTEPSVLDYLEGDRKLSADTLRSAGVGWDCDDLAIVFPVYNEQGELVNHIRRPLPHVHGPKYKVMRGRTRLNGGVQLYPQPLAADVPILLVEGLIDVLLLRQEGLTTAVTGTHGVGTFLDEWLPLFTGRRVAVAYDVGVEGIQRQRVAQLRGAGADAWSVRLSRLGLPPKGDLSDFLLNGGSVKQIKDLINREYRRR